MVKDTPKYGVFPGSNVGKCGPEKSQKKVFGQFSRSEFDSFCRQLFYFIFYLSIYLKLAK